MRHKALGEEHMKEISEVASTLDEAIKLHEVHMKKPSTATMASQTKLMWLLKSAREEL